MSLLQTRRLVLSLALSLLWASPAFAQAPTAPPQAAARQVQLKIAFVTASDADIDKSKVAFDRVPMALPDAPPSPMGPFLRYAVGDAADRLFQTLLHAGGKVVQAPLITTMTNVPASIQVNSLAMQSGLTITPRINNDDSISMNLSPQSVDTNGPPAVTGIPQAVTTLRTVRSGDTMALVGLPFRSAKPVNGQELLVFVTPILISAETQKADAGQQPELPSPPVRDMPPTAGRTISLDVTAGDLRAVVAMLERQVGIKALVPGGQTYKPVYVHLVSASLPKALAAIARSAGAQVTKNADGVYVFSPLPGSIQAPSPAAPADANGPSVIVSPDGTSVTITP